MTLEQLQANGFIAGGDLADGRVWAIQRASYRKVRLHVFPLHRMGDSSDDLW